MTVLLKHMGIMHLEYRNICAAYSLEVTEKIPPKVAETNKEAPVEHPVPDRQAAVGQPTRYSG